MKNIISKVLLCVLLSLGSCSEDDSAEKDTCSEIPCGEGVCVSATCNCDDGYQKDDDGLCTVSWASIFDGTLSEATHHIPMSVDHLESGTYFVIIQKASGNLQKQFIKA